ncbi:hypothetical protein EAO75_26505 [Streptomyces sp. uw30]|nr:hypothetical protein EAO75_26505 [Streptomyces sp. uw30]
MLTTFPLCVVPWLIVHLVLFNVELESRRQKGDDAVKGSQRLEQFTRAFALTVPPSPCAPSHLCCPFSA